MDQKETGAPEKFRITTFWSAYTAWELRAKLAERGHDGQAGLAYLISSVLSAVS
jgi:hypothetical protein